MKFKSGDVVIKTSGGNKMIVHTSINESYECIWYTDNFNLDNFSEDEIVSLDDYKNYLKIEERDDKLNKLLKRV